MSSSPRCSTSSASACSAPLRNSAAATSRVTILAYTMPIWSVLLAWPLLGERPTGTQAIGLGLCGAGARCADLPFGRERNSAGHPVGDRHRRELGGRHRLPEMGAHRRRSHGRCKLAAHDCVRRHRGVPAHIRRANSILVPRTPMRCSP